MLGWVMGEADCRVVRKLSTYHPAALVAGWMTLQEGRVCFMDFAQSCGYSSKR